MSNIDLLLQRLKNADTHGTPLTLMPQDIRAILARINELEEICAESYQVVGCLAYYADVLPESLAVCKALDNLSDMKLTHKDVLPFNPKV